MVFSTSVNCSTSGGLYCVRTIAFIKCRKRMTHPCSNRKNGAPCQSGTRRPINEALSFPSHRGGLDVYSRGASHHRRSLWQGGAGPRRHRRRGDEDQSVSADGTHAELLG